VLLNGFSGLAGDSFGVSGLEREQSREGARSRLVVLFVVYLVLLAWIVLWKLEAPWAGGARCA